MVNVCAGGKQNPRARRIAVTGSDGEGGVPRVVGRIRRVSQPDKEIGQVGILRFDGKMHGGSTVCIGCIGQKAVVHIGRPRFFKTAVFNKRAYLIQRRNCPLLDFRNRLLFFYRLLISTGKSVYGHNHQKQTYNQCCFFHKTPRNTKNPSRNAD